MPKDDYGYFGPNYSYANSIALPGEIGVRQEPTFDALIDSIGGVNYYLDVIAFGGPSLFDKNNPQPMGIRYYLNTEQKCSNGATMSDYFDGVTKGDLLGQQIADGLASAGLPGLKGLAPGMLENARDALDPRPILNAVTASAYPVCQAVSCPVGDIAGRLTDPRDPSINYLVDPVDRYDRQNLPNQIRWVQAYDKEGNPSVTTKDQYGATPKCYNPDGTYRTVPPPGCPATEPKRIDQRGTNRYKLCTVIQPPTAPPAGPTTEGFMDLSSSNTVLIAGLLGLTAAILIMYQ